jgi:hypothetical protein
MTKVGLCECQVVKKVYKLEQDMSLATLNTKPLNLTKVAAMSNL